MHVTIDTGSYCQRDGLFMIWFVLKFKRTSKSNVHASLKNTKIKVNLNR